MSTRLNSLRRLDAGKTARLVLESLKVTPNQSRSEIARSTGLRIQTVCGRATPLLNAGLIYVSGIKHDPDSDRMVETLALSEPETESIYTFEDIFREPATTADEIEDALIDAIDSRRAQ